MKETVRRLRETLTPIYGRGEAEAMTRLIFHSLKGWTLSQMLTNMDKELSPYMREQIDGILKRLRRHEPIQYILGEARFYGMDFKVAPGVLIPRQDTEPLVDMIVAQNPQPDLRVADVCTGSGCIAIALARNLNFPHVTAIDNSPEALAIARENGERLRARVTWVEEDVAQWRPSAGSLDIIVSNPPYIDESERAGLDANVRDWEPAEALFVPDSDPLKYYRIIADAGAKGLVAGGRLYFEINPRHAEELGKLLEDRGYQDIALTRDPHGLLRYAACRRPGGGRDDA